MTQLDDTTLDATEPVTGESDRRSMLRKMALASAGATVAVVGLGKVAEAGVEGTPTDSLQLGSTPTNTSATPTSLVHTPAAVVTAGASALSVGGAVPASDAVYPANVGGYGNAKVPNGLHGSTIAPAGFGVVAANLAPAATNATDPVPTGLAVASAAGAQMAFVKLAGAVVGPTPGAHVAGELYADANGTLWFTVPGALPADPVRFVKLAGTPAAGSYHAINPQRAYDSRISAYTPNGVLAPNASRVVRVRDGHSASGAVTLADAVPVGATAVFINLTAASPTEANYLSVASGSATATETSLVNWNLGVTQIANSITVPINAEREIKVFCGNQAGSTHFIVDVFGYYI